MKKATIGEAELDLLKHLAENGPCTVRSVSDDYGARKGYVRTTVLQMMERLRKKGFLDRTESEGGFLYRSTRGLGELDQFVVTSFVDASLGGSVSPLVAFLARREDLTDADVAALQKMVKDLEKRQGT